MLVLNEKLTPNEERKSLEDYKENLKNYDWCLSAEKRNVIKRLFLEPADTTYVTARWHFFKGLHFEFYWSSYHAIEKYLKAILLLNHQNTNNLGHNIIKAYGEVSNVAGTELLPDVFSRVLLDRISHITSMNDRSRLHYSGVEQYVSKIHSMGGVNSRYAMKSVSIRTTDIYCFDLTVFLLRRLAEDLSLDKNRQQLIDNPSQCPSRNAVLEKVFSTDNHPLLETTSKVNYFLVPEPNTSEFLRVGFGLAFSNSAIYNSIFENSESDDPLNQKLSKNVSNWIIENIQLDKNFKKEIRKFI